MLKQMKKDRGQALVIVAFGLAALIGMAALAIDGGNAYSDRRHAQNAADTAVLAAGLGFIRDPADWPTAEAAGFQKAGENGYDNNGTSNVVHVYQCTDVNAVCNLPPAEGYTDDNPANGMYDAGEIIDDTNGNGVRDTFDPQQFIQATIESHVPTYLARVVGIPQLSNRVQALAQAVPPSPTTWFNGRALVSLKRDCGGAGEPEPFRLRGNGFTLVNGSGVLVNSSCEPAFIQEGESSDMTVPTGGICVVGGVESSYSDVNPVPNDYCQPQVSQQLYQMPAVDHDTCTVAGSVIDEGGGNYLATPGYYDSVFPSMTPANILRFVSGVYCFRDDFTLSSNWADVTTDLDGNGTFDGSDGGNEGALFFVEEGSVTFNGGSTMHLGAMNNPSTHPAVKGFLLYLPPENDSDVQLSGNNGSQFAGTILAPSSSIQLVGASDGYSLEFDCQVIGNTIDVGGSGNLNITYHQSKTGMAWTSPVLQLYR